MKILFNIILILFVLLGVGALNTARQTRFRHLGLMLGSIIYLGSALVAYLIESWWPLLIGFGLAWVIRMLGGDPGKS